MVTYQFKTIKYTPQELQSNIHNSSASIIFNQLLVKADGERLIHEDEISEYKIISPKAMFYMEEWKEVLLYSNQFKAIISNYISVSLLDQVNQKRKAFSTNTIEIDRTRVVSKDERTNEL